MKRPAEETKQSIIGLILVLLGTLAVTSYIYHASPFLEIIKGSHFYLFGIILIVLGLILATFKLVPSSVEN
jgi:hypothetical protein